MTDWVPVMRRLAFAARTSGGTPGPDATLMEACDEAERLLMQTPDDMAVRLAHRLELDAEHLERNRIAPADSIARCIVADLREAADHLTLADSSPNEER